MIENWMQADLTINGNRIHYVRTGAGSGKPPLVLAHGFSDNGLCWEEAANELEAQFDVVMPDARGHGLSARVQPGEKIDMAADLAGVIEALGLDAPVVGGHSMGAMTASNLGAHFPRLARALLLEDPPWFMPRPQAEKVEAAAEKEERPPHPMGAFVQSLQVKTFEQLFAECRAEHPNWSELTARRWCEGKKQLDPNIVAVDNGLWSPWQGVVQAIQCPTLLVSSEPSLGGLITPESAQVITAMNTQVRVVNIPGVGHHVRFGAHAVYMKAVWAFLQEIA